MNDDIEENEIIDLTPEPTKKHRIADYSPKPGEVRNPHGAPVGSVHLSTIIERLLSKEIEWDKVPLKGGKKVQNRMLQRYGKKGWTAITYVAIAQAMNGDANARKWLSEAQYGNKIDITSRMIPQSADSIDAPTREQFIEFMKESTKAPLESGTIKELKEPEQ